MPNRRLEEGLVGVDIFLSDKGIIPRYTSEPEEVHSFFNPPLISNIVLVYRMRLLIACVAGVQGGGRGELGS